MPSTEIDTVSDNAVVYLLQRSLGSRGTVRINQAEHICIYIPWAEYPYRPSFGLYQSTSPSSPSLSTFTFRKAM